MASSFYNFKRITVVPTVTDFIDIVLSKTQRKTPTVVHPNYKITRIRQFYMRKVKFAQDAFNEKLNNILTEFPKLDEIHPFYADLMNVLYDRDHYKLALAQINTARHLIEQIAKDYVRLLKFADSLYRCKQLKKAALGRMATVMKRQKDSLAYLEQVRQHLARLPSIDPNTRTLLICGTPNVGKSSFMNKVTRTEVEVQPYAFTTKSLFVGHMDYKYLRWQVIDTPGILDHALEQRNTIEMQSITALAHLKACVLFFMDLSGQCGYSIKEQSNLFHSIKPLFSNKPCVLVINKIDVMRPEDLNPEDKALIDEIENSGATIVLSSCYTDEGVMDVKSTACEKLLASRVEVKMKSTRVNDVLNKLHFAVPVKRDNKERKPFIPDAVKNRVPYDPNDPNRRKLEKDIELENGGPGVYQVDLKKNYILKNDEWKYDVIPEIMDGKNVADFIDPEIEEKLDELEREEERLIAEGYYDSEEEMVDSDEEAIKEAAKEINEKKSIIIQKHRTNKSKNRLVVPRTATFARPAEKNIEDKFKELGVSDAPLTNRKRSRSTVRDSGEEAMRSASAMRGVSMVRDPAMAGLKNKKQKLEAESLMKKATKDIGLKSRRGEADRSIAVKMPKHLFSGKRGVGKTDRR
ncbi:GTP binding protein 4 [Anaeromyces robustus]|uniref:Nucleolar GTP-binding protein 1 n=1 Tax=Anaeromyces robustus TaxID=1754192 RepID=A0A1Y1XJ57_9FUNG|nr:GTP binding protein 4 [Anaeromyces robustus]|eukprot:ORX85722.1 GTP binding protein 4 [Anaeromyces robustus]